MSEIGDRLTATVILADYATSDTHGKATIVGAGLQFIGFDPNIGMSAPISLLVMLQCVLPAPEDQVAVEVLLVDSSGAPVELPGPAGPQTMRISQLVNFAEPSLPGVALPKGVVNSQATIMLNFPTGLPLTPGLSYSWRVQADHDVVATQPFFVPGARVGPVIG